METRITHAAKEVIIGGGKPTVLIGERINPTGRKKLAAALKGGDWEYLQEQALRQVEVGADILDVNVSMTGADQVSLLPRAVEVVMDVVDVPLCIDSDDPAALKASLEVYEGKPLVNSVTGEEKSLSSVLPLIEEYGAAVIGLTMDEEGIPTDPGKRVAIARKIVERAESLGIKRQDVVLDCLTLTIGADITSGVVTIGAIRRIKEELGVNMSSGASNISFGMPDRDCINNAFLAIIIASGVTCPIVNVAKVRPIVLATDLLMGRDKFAMRYIEDYRKRK